MNIEGKQFDSAACVTPSSTIIVWQIRKRKAIF